MGLLGERTYEMHQRMSKVLLRIGIGPNSKSAEKHREGQEEEEDPQGGRPEVRGEEGRRPDDSKFHT